MKENKSNGAIGPLLGEIVEPECSDYFSERQSSLAQGTLTLNYRVVKLDVEEVIDHAYGQTLEWADSILPVGEVFAISVGDFVANGGTVKIWAKGEVYDITRDDVVAAIIHYLPKSNEIIMIDGEAQLNVFELSNNAISEIMYYAVFKKGMQEG